MNDSHLLLAESFDKEANALLSFLQDFDLATGTSGDDMTAVGVTETPVETVGDAPRRPLTPHTLQPSQLPRQSQDEHKQYEKDVEDDNSLSTCPSLSAKTAARRTWVTRMAQALRQWKKKHESLTEQRLNEQKLQLQTLHNQQITQLRQELHQHYETMFLKWRKEYLRSTQADDDSSQKTPLHRLQQQQQSRKHWKTPEGKDITCYQNGTRREISPDGSSVTRFPNGDVQTTSATDSEDILQSPTKLCYFYGHTGILRMDQADGSVLWCFPNGQREMHRPDGQVDVKEWATATESAMGTSPKKPATV